MERFLAPTDLERMTLSDVGEPIVLQRTNVAIIT
jgi:hypothetical protein